MFQKYFAHGVAQAHNGREIGSLGRYSAFDLDRNCRPTREPLIAPQHRARTPNDAWQDRHSRLRRNFKGAKIERRKAGPPRKRTFGKKYDVAAGYGAPPPGFPISQPSEKLRAL